MSYYQCINSNRTISMNNLNSTALLTVMMLLSPLYSPAQNVTFNNYDGFLTIGTESNRTASITLVDIDNDHDLDVLLANGRHWAEKNYLYYNDGKAGFKKAQELGVFMEASYSMASADFNADGFMDIAVANDKVENTLLWGSDNGVFVFGTSFGHPGDFAEDWHQGMYWPVISIKMVMLI